MDVLITIVFVPFIVHRFVSQSVMVSLDIERKLLFRQHTNCEASAFADKVVIAALIDLFREGFKKRVERREVKPISIIIHFHRHSLLVSTLDFNYGCSWQVYSIYL